ncbi:hypothetical protein ACLMJK_001666 [Lecanora helva]
MSEDHIVRALQDFSSCDVSDALQKLGHPHGGFLSDLTLWSPQRQEGPTKIIGPAYTVKYIPKDQPANSTHKGHYIDTLPPHSILFISAPPTTTNAVYGGLMSNRAKYLNAAGTIVDGRIRDLQEHRDLGYPVFARGVGTAAPQGEVKVGEINGPVQFLFGDKEMTISPGDYLIGDLNGVVCLPKALADKAVALMGSQVEADERIARDLARGRSFQEASREHRARVKRAENL